MDRQAQRDNSPGERMRVLVLTSAIFLVTGVAALGLAVASGAGAWWALAGFAAIAAAGFGWGARAQVDAVRQSAPSEALTGRDVARYAAIALGLAALVAALAGISSALS